MFITICFTERKPKGLEDRNCMVICTEQFHGNMYNVIYILRILTIFYHWNMIK